tara:strand:- start:9055 stop:9630 length:576 start_codon:yes stop_codon:yes gene_type:complete
MIILSFDIGIKNLAYVILQINDDTIPNILDWEVISLCDTESKVKDISLITIGRNMQHILDSYFQTKWNIFSIDVVLIENQIGPLAIRMKTLQGMITQYFIQKNISQIEYWSSSNKLKPFLNENKKTNYRERKLLSIKVTLHLLDTFFNSWSHHYSSHKKKDDLSDCLLQCLHYSIKHNYTNIFNNADNLKL